MLLKRKYLFGTTVLAGVMAVSAPAFAQTAPAAAPVPQDPVATEIGEVVVTGSRIRRDPTTAPTPLIQIQREDILATGQATLIDYLAQIPALSNSQIPSDNVGGVLNAQGLNIANLRALGNNRTLTLIDGRRQVGSVGGSLAVSTNTIPRLLIENIEIITGGASSVYGADAVAGVINFQLRKDFEGLEIDGQVSQLTRSNGNFGKRLSALAGHNFFDDRVNVYAFGEYEQLDAIGTMDLGFLDDGCALVGLDSDPTNAAAGLPSDGFIDNEVFCGLRTISRPRGGQVTVANSQQPSPLNNPNVPLTNCTGYLQGTCYSVDPLKTWVFPDGQARLANFGQRIGNVGASRTLNIGGDGENPAFFNQSDRVGEVEARRFQVGTNIRLTDSISALFEAKYITEDTFATAQPTFFDFYMNDAAYAANATNGNASVSPSNQNQVLRVSDNAFLPTALRSAILNNRVRNFSSPTITEPGQPLATDIAAPWARYVSFGEDRSQDNNRQLERYVAAFNGSHGDFGPIRNLSWDLAYTYSKLENTNEEIAVDTQRYVLAADAVVDTAGIVNGRPGEIVCRVQLLNASNPAFTDPVTGAGGLRDWSTQAGQSPGSFGDLRSRAEGRAAINECVPLNIFGQGQASQEAQEYTFASVTVRQQNEQQNAIGSVSGQLWDFWGAGAIGVAIGGEWRKESTEGVGRNPGDRQLFLNTSPDQPLVSYETREAFAEVSLPLFRDTFLGEYAELSGSYRISDYSTVGQTDVYGVNLVYRPVSDFAIKSSFNTSVRVPTLVENFSPFGQTFANAFADPCTTAAITNPALAADIRANRIANCTALAAAKGLSYDFAGATLDPLDDYVPDYTAGVAGVLGGNPALLPEESESFTFSTVWTPSFIPRFNLVLDYYEIEIQNVIAAVTAPTAAANCVNGPTLNASACGTIFRRVAPVGTPVTVQDRSQAFKIGAPAGDPVGGFIQGSINYAKRTVRGLDFTASYSLDLEEVTGRNWGTLSNSLRGSWLIEQKQFNNIDNPADFTEFSSTLQQGGSFPRLRFANNLVWAPNDLMAFTWVADFQTAQDIVQLRALQGNLDNRTIDKTNTGNFVRHDFAARFNVREDLSLRVGVSNAFDARQRDILGATLYSNFDPYGRRFNISVNYVPF